ncbi:hypothetical protein [Roseobacter sp.]|uniref:hypothetical protein n=1 Tax=Roseobacter sp. TaxID=1907202 RepID=UPI00385EE0E2
MRAYILACAVFLSASPAWADARVTVLMDALRVPDLVASIRQEGLADARHLNEDILSGQGGAFWQGQVDGLYNTSAMQDVLYVALLNGLEATDLDEALLFFDSHQGQRIVELEVAARKAMIDASVQDIASEAYNKLAAHDDPHAVLVAQFIEANDLLELNVAVTLSTSYQFQRGLSDGGLVKRSDNNILADVWASEAEVRAAAQDWLFGYFLLAYQPLEISDLEALLAFFQRPAGKALNAAFFAGSEQMFTDIAYGLGRAVALNAVGDDI